MKKGCCLTILLAWVLWERTEVWTQNYIGIFEPIKAYNTKKECDVGAEEEYRLAQNRTFFLLGKGYPGKPGVLDKNGRERESFQTILRCLPDNIDPRK